MDTPTHPGDATLPAWTFGEVVLGAILIGTFVFGSHFAHIRIGPLFVTDAALLTLVGFAGLFYPQRLFAWGRIELLIAAFVGLALMHTVARLERGIWTVKDAAIGAYAGFALLVPVFVDNRQRIRRMVRVVVVAAVSLAGWALFWPDVGGNTSFFLGAGALCLVIGMSFGGRWLGVPLFCLFVLEMMTSGRRASAVALIVSIGGLLIALPPMARRRCVRAVAGIVCLGVVGGMIALSVPSFAERVRAGAARYRSGTVGYQSDGTAQWRLGAWRIARGIVREHPLVGVGFGERINVYPEQEPLDKIKRNYNYGLPHNTFLTIALKMGIPGLCLLLAVLVVWFRRMWVLRRGADWAGGLLALGLYGCCFGAFSLFFERPFMAMPFWIVVGLGLALDRVERTTSLAPAIELPRR